MKKIAIVNACAFCDLHLQLREWHGDKSISISYTILQTILK